jgi:hypothetical protein
LVAQASSLRPAPQDAGATKNFSEFSPLTSKTPAVALGKISIIC